MLVGRNDDYNLTTAAAKFHKDFNHFPISNKTFVCLFPSINS